MFDFEIKIAQNEEEVRQALRLRHEVFNLEMEGNLKGKEDLEFETDIYDKFSQHLVVIDKTVNKTIGTYRLILGSRLDKKIGFYSERLFDISNIKGLAKKYEVLELGRSCIHKDYRSRPVINLLWSGIAKYIKDYKVRYLFGPVRLLSNDPREVSKTFKFIKERFYSEPEFRVYPRVKNRFGGLDEDIQIENTDEIFRSLPPLVKGYLRVGVKVCGLPAINFDLGSVVIFIILDVGNMSSAYKQHYL